MASNQSRSGMWRFLGWAGFILLLIVGFMVIYPARVQYNRQRDLYEKIRAEVEKKRAERDRLQQEVADLKSNPAAVERVARTKFRLCKEGEVILYYEKPRRDNGSSNSR